MFHADVWPIPISVSPTQADFLLADVACPIKPETLSSFVVYDRIRDNFREGEGGGQLYLNVKRRVETHLEVSLLVFGEDPEETLFENRSGEGV